MAAPFTQLGRVVVLVDDQDAALAFYRDVLGFEVLHDSEDGGFRYLHVGLPGWGGPGIWLMPANDSGTRSLVGRQAGAHPLLVLYTDDIEATRTGLEAAGVKVWQDRDDDGSRSFHFRDVSGNTLIAVQLTQ
ncbi:MAG TPA: VOC family protein [Thermoleophilaceae bacterium]